MSARDDGGPAFPVQDAAKWQAHGLSIRDYFAAKAMQSLMDAGNLRDHGMVETLPQLAYAFADSMLKARQS